jgi:hypothetical protein
LDYWPQKFSKIRVLKVNYFHLPRKKNTSNRNHGLILMLLLFFTNKIQNLYQFSEKKSQKMDKRGGGAKVDKSLNVEVGINVEGGIFWKKPVNKAKKRGVEGGKI